ncbi:rhodanese-like domain-containing protein [Saccharicrinis fermentans]|uniref:Thiosulfate sulfurtransferase PspE n=1 Tax=Saccharicrinis fermentans DSM 9555 = JCM 21142 TaxID=869213 RepID=W7YBJ4_9BACT|nr:rhodanese-like domain-containing protein [Saccharicrinis fermentans]GAF01806.1 thiosulfate sulfurtransferase PspE precursor [Saccharicrinis fermentans DSM 9555 = JCM 21142]
MKFIFCLGLFFVLTINGFSQKSSILECDEFYNSIYTLNDVVIFDIRIKESYQKFRIKDALWAGTKERLRSYLKDIEKNTTLFVYCEIGKRSKDCVELLDSLGYRNVFQLKDGIREWKKNGYPIDRSRIKDKL